MTRGPVQSWPAAAARITAFHYPTVPREDSPWKCWEDSLTACEPPAGETSEPSPEALASIETETRSAFERGFAQGLDEGRTQERAHQCAADAERSARLAAALDAFGAARDDILQMLEPEVVRLAVAIAARILRREAQTDPLLLTGAVRVALGQLGASAEARLRVPAAEQQMWAEWIAMLPNTRSKIHVEAGEGMRAGECVVETDFGSVDLGVRAQLREVEHALLEDARG